MIVDKGKKRIAELITGIEDGSRTTFTQVRVGDGGDSTSMSQTTLDSQVANKAVTPTLVGNTLIYEIELLGSDLSSNIISELGIFDGTGADANMLCRVSFDPIGPITASETLTFNFRVEIE